MGRPPKPVEHKRRTGNPGKRPLPPRAALVAVPPVDAARVELEPAVAFARILEAGAPWLAFTDAVLLALVRESLKERVGLRAAVLAGRGKRSELRALDAQLVSMLSSLGFSPSDRARLGLAEVAAASRLDEMRRR